MNKKGLTKTEIIKFINRYGVAKQMKFLATLIDESTNKFRLKLTYGGDTFTDGKDVFIGIPEYLENHTKEEIISSCKAMVGHEVSHKNYTDNKGWEDFINGVSEYLSSKHNLNIGITKKVAHYIINSIEDGRIERLLVLAYPGLKSNLVLFRSYWWKYQPIQNTDDNELFDTLFAICTKATMGILPKGYVNIYSNNDELFELLDKVDKDIQNAVNCNTFEGCSKYGWKIVKIMEDWLVKHLSKYDIDDLSDLLDDLMSQFGEISEESCSGGGMSIPMPSKADINADNSNSDDDDDESGNQSKSKSNTTDTDDTQNDDKSGNSPEDGDTDEDEDSSDEEGHTSSKDSGNNDEETDEDKDDNNSSSNTDGEGEEDEEEDDEDGSSSSENNNNEDENNQDEGDCQFEGDASNDDNDEANSIHDSFVDIHKQVDNIEDKLSNSEIDRLIEKSISDAMTELISDAENSIIQAEFDDLKEAKKEEEAKLKELGTNLTPDDINDIYEGKQPKGFNWRVPIRFIKTQYHKSEAPQDIKGESLKAKKEFKKILENKSIRNSRNRRRGSLDTKSLWKLGVKDYSIFEKKGNPKNKDFVFSILVDGSGSMSGYKYFEAYKATSMLEEALKEVVPLKITQFTASSYGVIHNNIKDFDEVRGNCSWSFLNNNRANGCNMDGYSIRVALKELYKRNEKDKVLIILSDGQPNAYNGYEGYLAQTDVKEVIREGRKNNIKIFNIMFGSQSDREEMIEDFKFMYEKGIVSCAPEDINKSLLKIVERELLR